MSVLSWTAGVSVLAGYERQQLPNSEPSDSLVL
jgi:hypothetical protein